MEGPGWGWRTPRRAAALAHTQRTQRQHPCMPGSLAMHSALRPRLRSRLAVPRAVRTNVGRLHGCPLLLRCFRARQQVVHTSVRWAGKSRVARGAGCEQHATQQLHRCAPRTVLLKRGDGVLERRGQRREILHH